MKFKLIITLLINLIIIMTFKPLVSSDTDKIHDMVGQMIIAGFRGVELNPASPIVRDLSEYNLGGIILFDYDVLLKSRQRNIIAPHQLQALTSDLAAYSSYPLFIAVDQEGGAVARLKERNGFTNTLPAGELGILNDLVKTKQQGEIIGKMLSQNGINMNLAPVVDLNTNPQNPIIGKINRSFSSEPQPVVKHSRAFIEGLKKHNIINCLKHFPGHGSSTEDSHLGITDITDTWSAEELIPYKDLIASSTADMIMVGHLVNNNMDSKYPATLSRKIITGMLREKLSYDGVVISDDLGMKAITDQYSLQETVYLALDAGVDILLFGNNMEYNEDILPKVHRIIMSLIDDHKITVDRIRDSYQRIMKLKKRI